MQPLWKYVNVNNSVEFLQWHKLQRAHLKSEDGVYLCCVDGSGF